MKIHRKYIYAAVICLALSGSSCSKDFLNQPSESSLNGASFWKTESDLKQGVVGAYRTLRDQGLFDYWALGEMRSDNTTFQYNGPERGQENRELIDQFQINSANTLLQQFWQQSYIGIARCNDVLDHVQRIPMSEDSRNQAIGEVKTLRSFYYFNLVRQFGAVPLRVDVAKTPADAQSKSRASVEEIYAVIIADLTDAAEKLPAVGAYSEADKGRVSKGTAYTLLGKVYMTQKKFDQALTALRKVTGYQLMSSYAEIFVPQNKNNKESIFEIQYLGSISDLASNFMYQFAPFNSGNIVTQDKNTNLNYNSGWNTPTSDIIAAYENGDLRKDVSLGEGFMDKGVFVAAPYVKKYNHGFIQPGQTDVNFPILRYGDVLLMISECLNEQGFVMDGEAFKLLNDIRVRAGLAPKSAGNSVLELRVGTQEQFREAIYKERQVELAFENHRWYDLVRTGRAVKVMSEHGKREMAKNPSTIPVGSYQITENKLLLQIPQREVNLDNLTQNPL